MLLDLTNIPNLLPWLSSSSSSNNNKGCGRERTDDCHFEKALRLSLQRFQASRDQNSQIPRLSPDDIGIGKKLGEGSFGIIHEVQYLSETAQILQQPQNETGYAVKQLHPSISNKHKRRRLQAIVDFETERRILSCIHHPNIVQVYGIVRQPHSSMIVMDRLFETLDTRLVQWRRTHLRELYLTGNILEDEDIDINPKRLQIVLDVASALDYLHSQNIIHRDVKPSNVAFDMHGNIKLFDFGLAREFKPRQIDKYGTYSYQYTALVGSPRYMAPEVANRLQYNESCDVYSFTLLLWEVLSLQQPFQELSPCSMREQVWAGPQTRPRLDSTTCPLSLQDLVKLGWSADASDRPTMNVVSLILGSVYCTMMHHVEEETKQEEDLLQLSFTNPVSLPFPTKKRLLPLESILLL